MSQTGFTPLLIYSSSTTANVPLASNLTNNASGSELAINITDGKLFYKDNLGAVQVIATKTSTVNVSSFSAGTTGFTPATATTGVVTLAGTLATTNGGTALTVFTANQVFYASSTSVFAQSTNLQFNGTTLNVNALALGGTQNQQIGQGNASLLKNRIINGAMVIDQRNAGASVTPTNGAYTLDRWQSILSQTAKFSVQQNAGSVTASIGFNNYLGVTSLSAFSSASTDYFYQAQPIEGFNFQDLGWGTASAKTVTLSASVYSSLTGTFSGSLVNSAETRSYPFTFSIPVANTWTSISVTIVGDTSGTWLGGSSIGCRVNLNLGSGSIYLGTAGAWATANYKGVTGSVSVVGTSGATFYFVGVQLEAGSSATGFEYRQYTTELALCQRYYQKVAGQFYGATNYTGLLSGFSFPLDINMRSAPSVSGTYNVSQSRGAAPWTVSQTTGITLDNSTVTYWLNLQVANNSTQTAGICAVIYDSSFLLSSEL